MKPAHEGRAWVRTESGSGNNAESSAGRTAEGEMIYAAREGRIHSMRAVQFWIEINENWVALAATEGVPRRDEGRGAGQ